MLTEHVPHVQEVGRCLPFNGASLLTEHPYTCKPVTVTRGDTPQWCTRAAAACRPQQQGCPGDASILGSRGLALNLAVCDLACCLLLAATRQSRQPPALYVTVCQRRRRTTCRRVRGVRRQQHVLCTPVFRIMVTRDVHVQLAHLHVAVSPHAAPPRALHVPHRRPAPVAAPASPCLRALQHRHSVPGTHTPHATKGKHQAA